MFRTEISLGALEFGKLEAILELATLAAKADGRIEERERTAFHRLVVERSGGRLDEKLADVIFEKLAAPRAESVEDRLLRLRKQLPDRKLREGALLLAANLVFADGSLHVDEQAFLARAATALEIEDDALRAILDQARAQL